MRSLRTPGTPVQAKIKRLEDEKERLERLVQTELRTSKAADSTLKNGLKAVGALAAAAPRVTSDTAGSGECSLCNKKEETVGATLAICAGREAVLSLRSLLWWSS